jgi:hypothetical protein
MGIEYKVFKRGSYWIVVLTTEDSNEIFFLTFMKGATFKQIDSLSKIIYSNEENYKQRLSDELLSRTKEEIISNNNYLKTHPEEIVTDEKIPNQLLSKMMTFINSKK